MIVSGKHKVVYIAIPKTGSRSMSYWLIDNYEAINLKGQVGSAFRGTHSHSVPARYKSYTRFTIVRNPYERLFSQWWHNCGGRDVMDSVEMIPTVEEANKILLMTFEEWMDQFIYYKRRNMHARSMHNGVRTCVPRSSLTQSEFVDRGKIEYVVHLENIDEGIKTIPQFKNGPKMHHLHLSTNKPDKTFNEFFQSKHLEQKVWNYCSEDFKRFGYDRIG